MAHDRLIHRMNFEVGQRVWLFKSRLKLFPGKLRSRWSGPYLVTHVAPHGAVEIQDPTTGGTWKVNGQRLKRFVEPHSEGAWEEIRSLGEPFYPPEL